MPPETPEAEEARLWISKARGDLRAGAHGLTAAEPMTGDAAFHAQQAAEKAIKAFLVLRRVRFRKTHDLRELGGLARKKEALALAAALVAAVEARLGGAF